MSKKNQTAEEKALAEELAERQSQLDAATEPEAQQHEHRGTVGAAFNRPVPPTSPAPGPNAARPVSIEPRAEGRPAGSQGRLTDPIGKRGRFAAERAARLGETG